jgi:hypothetical protein
MNARSGGPVRHTDPSHYAPVGAQRRVDRIQPQALVNLVRIKDRLIYGECYREP